MKRILMTTAIAALVASPVLAASEDADENASMTSDSASMSQDTAGAEGKKDVVSDVQGMQISASDLIGKAVYIRGEDAAEGEISNEAEQPAEDWERIGEIGDVIISADGNIESVTLDAGGFLGINEKHISTSMDEVKFVADTSEASDENDGDSYFVVFTGDKTALEDRDELDQAAVRDTGSSFFNEDSEQMANADMDEDASEENAEASDTDLSAQQTAENESAESDNAEMAEQDTEEMTDGEAAETAETDMTSEADNEEMAESDAANEEDTDLTATQMSENDDGMENAEAADQQTAELDNEARGQLTAEELEGVSVYGADDDRLGEISDLVLSEDGRISEVIVDVGGFLGLGEKPVALPFDELELRRSDDAMTGGLRATTGYSSEELEGMDSWEG